MGLSLSGYGQGCCGQGLYLVESAVAAITLASTAARSTIWA
jgi:hypothetical protein